MAGNDWINSYLEAILDVGPALDDKKSSLLLRERGRFSPTRYFVEEVITGFDETDLYRSWVKVPFNPLSLCISSSFLSVILSFPVRSMLRPRQQGVPRRETPGWKTCVGGFGTWPVRRSRLRSLSLSNPTPFL